MADDKLALIGKAVVAAGAVAVGGAPVAIAAAIVGVIFKQPDLPGQINAVLLEDIGRLRRDLEALVESLTEVRSEKINVLEAHELITQTVINFGRTASEARRSLMLAALTGCFVDRPWNGAEYRFFVRLAGELEPEHIRLLQGPAPPTLEVDGGLVEAWRGELVARGLMVRNDKAELDYTPLRRGGDEPEVRITSRTHVTSLGERFLEHLRGEGRCMAGRF
jgi:hypothetical protein